jgi:predicted 3-demethylubiquinone-9 3-methyltransferase (glyoxalase superfamily)
VGRQWNRLAVEGGKTNQCGWLDDKFGVTRQVVPTILPKLLKDEDPRKAQRVMQAMMQMTKLDIAALERAAEG